jgi:hypothetical protein
MTLGSLGVILLAVILSNITQGNVPKSSWPGHHVEQRCHPDWQSTEHERICDQVWEPDASAATPAGGNSQALASASTQLPSPPPTSSSHDPVTGLVAQNMPSGVLISWTEPNKSGQISYELMDKILGEDQWKTIATLDINQRSISLKRSETSGVTVFRLVTHFDNGIDATSKDFAIPGQFTF